MTIIKSDYDDWSNKIHGLPCALYFYLIDVDDIDILICSFFPVFKKYVDAKKPLDDNFFKDVLNSSDFKKKFMNSKQLKGFYDKNITAEK